MFLVERKNKWNKGWMKGERVDGKKEVKGDFRQRCREEWNGKREELWRGGCMKKG